VGSTPVVGSTLVASPVLDPVPVNPDSPVLAVPVSAVLSLLALSPPQALIIKPREGDTTNKRMGQPPKWRG
jgi:hypothetical protein